MRTRYPGGDPGITRAAMRRPSRRTLLPLLALVAVPVAWQASRRARPRLALMRGGSTVSVAELAGRLWGPGEANSHSAGAQRVRGAARELFPAHAPGHGGEWRFTATQVERLREHLEARDPHAVRVGTCARSVRSPGGCMHPPVPLRPRR